MKPGLYANINAKRKRIEAGSGEKMNKVGSKAAPTDADFKNCLLYTSPSPRDRQKSRMPSSA